MLDKEIYFNELPQLGDLALEYVFYEMDEPILFVCIDANQDKFLCSCCFLSENWLIAKVSRNQLTSLIDNEITLAELFQQCPERYFVEWDGERFSLTDKDIPSDAYPRKGAFLRLPPERTAEYRQELSGAEYQRELSHMVEYQPTDANIFLVEELNLSESEPQSVWQGELTPDMKSDGGGISPLSYKNISVSPESCDYEAVLFCNSPAQNAENISDDSVLKKAA